MEEVLEVYQFLSRKNIDNRLLGEINSSPKQRPDIKFSIKFEIIDKPFEINFTNIIPSQPSIGASEYIDPYIDVYMKERWPKCIKGKGKVIFPKSDQSNKQVLKQIFRYARDKCCWQHKENFPFLIQDIDQYATQQAFRREYFSAQIFDIHGNRRPNSSRNYYLTDVGEYVGPGLCSFPNILFGEINEFVWSQLIPIKNPQDKVSDSIRINEKLLEIRKHYNTYNELNDARRLLSNNELKSSIRSAAASVDAILRYYCTFWEVSFPGRRNLQFIEKIEDVLFNAGKPSFRRLDPINSDKLLYLYRARSSMHEGDCYYKDKSGTIIQITKKEQVEDLLNAAEKFTLWIDSLV